MNRLEQTFQFIKESDTKAFVPYIMAGDGGLDCLVERLTLLEKFGATAIEVGVPFSDPVADGPVIQQAGIRALQTGTTLRGILTELKRAKEVVKIPIILMTYLNPVYAYGIIKFVQEIQEAGVSGCIIPDLPLEEEHMIVPHLEAADIELVRLVTLTSSIERVKQIASHGKGFLYTVTVKGITGTRKEFNQHLYSFLQTVSDISPIPVLAGFGISTPEQVEQISTYCNGVVVGSKIVELFANNQIEQIEKLISVCKPKLV
ncbi:tryptophan synthase subunit alpha [Bacillus rubiinfantis]|uniref:tryptophan synthase subunit alpha n=1 Tax=Bacillus rubiinfantis TaxID=1499680 RepID=UPI0005AB39D7|nr:tryptophan synthase subunit alpha [Bacillus rubiinfantis]